ncbi:MAG: MipA/OmpV family protein [Burkholderiales bacterium]|nr:MAG: MipA/OmpV family protein [Burkholderiales bacterium]
MRTRPPAGAIAGAVALAASLWMQTAGAQATAPEAPPTQPTEASRTPPALPLWELGVLGFGVSQQAYPGSSEQVVRGLPAPFFLYRGEILRADRTGAGLRAIRTPELELDIGFAASFGSNSSDIEARRGMPDLGTLVEFGPRLKWQPRPGPIDEGVRLDLPLRGVFDLNDRLANRGVAFEPALILERQVPGRWSWRASAGALLGDARLAGHLYSVAPAFATADRPAYDARAGLIAWRLGASFSRNLTADLRLFGFLRIDTAAGSTNASSPLVDRVTGASAGVGLAYTFMRSGRSAAD